MSPIPTLDDLHREQSERVYKGARFLVGGIVVALVLLLGRVVQIKLLPDERLASAAGLTHSSRAELGRRGELRDRTGRMLAGSQIGWRLFVDPAAANDPMTLALDVAQLIAADPAEIDRLIARRPGSRYVVIDHELEDWQVEQVRQANLAGVGLEPRLVRRYPFGDLGAGIIGLVGIDHDGLAGAEHLYDESLDPAAGQFTYLRDARRRTLWVEPSQYQRAADGEDIRLGLDLVIQEIAERHLQAAVERHHAGGGRMVVADPHTGEILAMCDILNSRPGWDEQADDPLREENPRLGRNRCVTDPYEPGSTFKPFVWAIATELGKADPNEVLDTPTSNGHRTSRGRLIRDTHYYGRVSWRKVLVKSMNSGMAIVAERLTNREMQEAVSSFGFSAKTDCGLPGESAGIVTSPRNWSHYSQTSVAMGHEIAVTPVQMVRAFSVFCRDGTLPSLTMLAVEDPDDPEAEVELVHRVISPEMTELVRGALRDVMTEGTGRKAQSQFYRLFGKSGTAQLPKKGGGGYHENRYVSSFIAGAPFEAPRVVVLCVIDDPDKSVGEYYGGAIAGPVVRDVIDETLQYLGVRPDKSPDEITDMSGSVAD